MALMCALRWLHRVTSKIEYELSLRKENNKIGLEFTQGNMWVLQTEEKIKVSHFRRIGHVNRRPEKTFVVRTEQVQKN